MTSAEPPIQFFRAHPTTLAPLAADKAALGMLPVSAFQYCEAMRVASSFGWYIFPPESISLMFDGHELFLADEGQWRSFTHEPFGSEFQSVWEQFAPPELHGHAPSFIRKFTEPGTFQIWSGLFVQTQPGYNLQLRPLVNINTVSAFTCFEGIVETDQFAPMPLFMNFKILRTGSEIYIDSEFPLFQVCAVEKTTTRDQRSNTQNLSESTDGFSWDELKKTIRVEGVTEERKRVGDYGARMRKKGRQK